MTGRSAQPVASLYVHVPFCARKCEYCAFYSETTSGELVNRYVAALIREMQLVANDLNPRTVFFGGGTPSLLNLRQWEQILKAMERLNLLGAAEWTVECNPATVSLDKARLLRAGGVNRISMGVQSLNEELLDRLGRVHSREMVFKSFAVLRQAGFDNVNIDLMFAIPGQWPSAANISPATKSSTRRTRRCTRSCRPANSVSMKTWPVRCMKNCSSPLRRPVCGSMKSPISHGIFPERASRLPTARVNTMSITGEQLAPLARAGETAAFGLRMNAGWPFEVFQRATGYDLRQEWPAEMNQLASQGWGKIEAERFRLTRQGLRFADAAAEQFLRS